jgi:NAD(P)H dehydrogenase (quinone)
MAACLRRERMMKPKILVSGATGKTGAATVAQLLAKGFTVRALARRADPRSDQLRKLGAEVVIGSLEDLKDLRAAMIGVQRAYYCPPLEPGTLRRATCLPSRRGKPDWKV